MCRVSPVFILPQVKFQAVVKLIGYLFAWRCYFNDVEEVLKLKGDLNVSTVTENFKTNG